MSKVKTAVIRYEAAWDDFVNSGSMKALSVVYHVHFDYLFNYGRRFTNEDHLIEDAIQNVFTNLIKSGSKLRRVNNIRFYLIITFRNELFQQIRHSRKLSLGVQPGEINFAPSYTIEDEIVREEGRWSIKKALLRSLQKLTPKQQEVLYMRYDCGLSYEEISQTLDISVESCRTAVYRAVKSIRSEFDQLNIKGINLFVCFFRQIFSPFR